MTEEKNGVIIKGVGGFYTVDIGGPTVVCRARGRLRHENMIPTIGDRVVITLLPDGSGRLESIEKRRNIFSRPSVSNIDCMVIVVSEAPPISDTLVIDTMTVSAELKGIDSVICINKCDIDPSHTLYEIYHNAGYPVFRVSAETGEGIDALCDELRGRTCAFTGNSGVGKSSLLNRIEPGLSLKVGEVSERLGRGKHTTRHVELFRLSCGAIVADTPGFSAFEFGQTEGFEKDALKGAFPDFRPFAEKCRFIGCSHIKDEGCAVREAAENGRIEQSRYVSYVRLVQDAESQEYGRYEK
jgi:ribosome biogenesis GTPase